jgi:ABC-type multidrug transport system fused ATPase/permease subunit
VNLKYTDSRVKLTNEILQGVRAIKSYNWEKPFVEKLTTIRDLELKALEASANTRAILTSVLTAAPSMVAVITLGTYGLLGNVLTPTKVFTALALFNQLRFPLVFLPLLLNNLAEGKVSLVRLTKFLLTDEVQDYVERDDETANDFMGKRLGHHNQDAVLIEKGTFSWNSNLENVSQLPSEVSATSTDVEATVDTSKAPVAENRRGFLSNIDLKVKKGELIAIVGPVGSGKSSLLSALLGELNKQEGRVKVLGSVAYVPQSAWIPNESLRNVILFGRNFDKAKYEETIEACGLTKDLQQLEGGDETEIGERGVNLSGGQKQRVSIARAVYDDADIFLFDDPLSALDAEVGANVFNNCIKTLLHDKTRILVTHQLGVLPEVDRVVLMGTAEDGSATIIAQGSLDELLARGYDLSKHVRSAEESLEASEDGETDSENESVDDKNSVNTIKLSTHQEDAVANEKDRESESKLSVDYKIAIKVTTSGSQNVDSSASSPAFVDAMTGEILHDAGMTPLFLQLSYFATSAI